MAERFSICRVKHPITPMKTWLVGCGVLLAITTATLSSQAGTAPMGRVLPQEELDVRAAVNRLIEAGNYTWEESHGVGLLGSTHIPIPMGAGETVIDGYTTARYRRRVVMRGSEVVLELTTGWRHAKDLTAENIEELGQPPTSRATRAVAKANIIEPPPKSDWEKRADALRARSYTPVLPHELLRFLMQDAVNFRKVGATVVAEVATNLRTISRLRSYLLMGVLEPEASTPVRILLRAAPPPRSLDEVATLYVTLNGGLIEEFSVEIVTPSSTSVFITKLLKVGTTTVNVDTEAKALFLDVSGLP
jgi:hypothetical protein